MIGWGGRGGALQLALVSCFCHDLVSPHVLFGAVPLMALQLGLCDPETWDPLP